MLKWYADMFKLTEKQMTKKALNRLKILTLASLPAIPFIILIAFAKTSTEPQAEVSSGLENLIIGLIIISVIALLALCFCKFTNRFWARDKYLDEWEVARKHQAMAFSYQLFCYIIAAFLLYFTFFSGRESQKILEFGSVSYHQISVVLFALLMMFLYSAHLFLLFTVKPIDEIVTEDALN